MKKVNGMKRKINQHTVPRCESEDKNRDRFSSSFFFTSDSRASHEIEKKRVQKIAFAVRIYLSRLSVTGCVR